MCITKLSRHPACGHWSCEIIEPCKEGRNFSNCPSFTTGKARKPAKYPQESAKENTCPKCDQKDDYDGKNIRMVKGTVHATKFGLGPSVSYLLQDRCSMPLSLFVRHLELRDWSRLSRTVQQPRYGSQREILTEQTFRGQTAGLIWAGNRGSMSQRRKKTKCY